MIVPLEGLPSFILSLDDLGSCDFAFPCPPKLDDQTEPFFVKRFQISLHSIARLIQPSSKLTVNQRIGKTTHHEVGKFGLSYEAQ